MFNSRQQMVNIGMAVSKELGTPAANLRINTSIDNSPQAMPQLYNMFTPEQINVPYYEKQ